jgi:hypothetical protein
VIVDNGHGLVWMGSVPPLETEARHGAEAESQFHALLLAVMGLLQRERRTTYRTLTYLLRLDAALLEEVREELTLRRCAYDEEGKVLVWTGRAILRNIWVMGSWSILAILPRMRTMPSGPCTPAWGLWTRWAP